MLMQNQRAELIIKTITVAGLHTRHQSDCQKTALRYWLNRGFRQEALGSDSKWSRVSASCL